MTSNLAIVTRNELASPEEKHKSFWLVYQPDGHVKGVVVDHDVHGMPVVIGREE